MIDKHILLAVGLAVIISVSAYILKQPVMLVTYGLGFGIGAMMK